MSSRRVTTWEEQDAYTGWRRYLHWRPGQIAVIKRRTHKRERREAQARIETELRRELGGSGDES